MTQFPFQPPALVGNPFSDAYFGALFRQRPEGVASCAHCRAQLLDRKLTDGVLSWCDAAHRELWARNQRDGRDQLSLVERGMSADRWAAAHPHKSTKEGAQ